ncbi:hypothetical protein HDZ31DRAFT_49814 [Schizophyllum fasciatum]
MPADRTSKNPALDKWPRTSYRDVLKNLPKDQRKGPPRRRAPRNDGPPQVASPEERARAIAHLTPEFRTRWLAACDRMHAAMQGTLPPDAPPVFYSKVYSYYPRVCRTEAGTPYEPQAFRTSRHGTLLNRLSDEVMDLVLELNHGSAEAGLAAVKRDQARVVGVIGGRPDPDDPSIQDIHIPGQEYFIRLWMGGMDWTRTVCWNIMDRATNRAVPRPASLQLFASDDSGRARHKLYSLESTSGIDNPCAETFLAHDGERVEFIVGETLLKTIRLPQRACQLPPVEAKPLEIIFDLHT